MHDVHVGLAVGRDAPAGAEAVGYAITSARRYGPVASTSPFDS
jgi:hypothetical protein